MEIEEQIASLGLRDRVVIHDRYFSGNDVSLCFAAADAVVLPYRSATQSGVIPIAVALNTPVIATRAGGLDEAMQSNRIGIVIENPEPQAIAVAVKQFYAANGRDAFAEGLYAAAKRQSWDEFISVVARLNTEIRK